MNLKLVKLEEKYKKHLFDMMEEWYSSGEDIYPYSIYKNDYKINSFGRQVRTEK